MSRRRALGQELPLRIARPKRTLAVTLRRTEHPLNDVKAQIYRIVDLVSYECVRVHEQARLSIQDLPSLADSKRRQLCRSEA
jgi:hypothetical protein